MTLFSTKISAKMTDIGEVAYQSEWYEYPKFIDIYVLLIIQNAQRVKYLTGFQIVYCNLDTFGKVQIILMYELLFIVFDEL